MAAGYKRNWNNLRGAWGKREIPAAIAKGLIHFLFFYFLCKLSDVRVTWMRYANAYVYILKF